MARPTRAPARVDHAPASTTGTTTGATTAGTGRGLVLALVSAASFAASGPLGKSLLDSGWSPGAAVAVRVGGAGLAFAVPAAISLRGRWSVLRANAGSIVLYGLLAVCAAQLGFFSAARTIPVGTALLIAHLAPLPVVLWVWVVQRRRPGLATAIGAAVAVAGTALVLEVAAGGVDLAGVGWALFAACGLAGYYLVSEREDPDLPPLVLAAGGFAVATVALALTGAVGLLPMAATSEPVRLLGHAVPVALPMVSVALVCTALPYITGTAAARLLGSRLAAFLGLTEVLFAVVFSWVLLGQSFGPLQVVGGVLVVAGIVLVRADRRGGRAAPKDTSYT